MADKARKDPDPVDRSAIDDLPGGNGQGNEDEAQDFRVQDRRHWVEPGEDAPEDGDAPSEPRQPTMIDQYRQRTEDAERKLQEYIEAFKGFKEEHEQFRERLNRDVDRRVELKFGELVGQLLESMDDLDLAVEHAAGIAAAEPLVKGVGMARRRFLKTLEHHGVARVTPDGEEFDPNLAEAVRVDPVETRERDNTITETLRPGYRLGDRVIRPARVAVGRHAGN